MYVINIDLCEICSQGVPCSRQRGSIRRAAYTSNRGNLRSKIGNQLINMLLPPPYSRPSTSGMSVYPEASRGWLRRRCTTSPPSMQAGQRCIGVRGTVAGAAAILRYARLALRHGRVPASTHRQQRFFSARRWTWQRVTPARTQQQTSPVSPSSKSTALYSDARRTIAPYSGPIGSRGLIMLL